MKTIWPSERIPIDLWFKVPQGDAISTPQKSVYDISDNAKTDLSTTLVDASGVNYGQIGHGIRLTVHNMTLGKTYHFQGDAETLNGRTLIEVMLVQCGTQSDTISSFVYGGRKSYTISYDDKLPDTVTIDPTNTDNFTAYDITDMSTNIWSALGAVVSSNRNILNIDIENLTKNHTYIINAMVVTTLDPITNSTYKAGKKLVVLCKEK